MKTSHEIKNTAQYKGFKAFYRGLFTPTASLSAALVTFRRFAINAMRATVSAGLYSFIFSPLVLCHKYNSVILYMYTKFGFIPKKNIKRIDIMGE